MELQELNDRSAEAKNRIEREFGSLPSSLGVFPGTGWKDGLDACLEQQGEIPYAELKIPGLSSSSIAGHSKSLRFGHVGGRPVIAMGRVHANESKDPDATLGTRVVMGAVKDSLDGVIVTHGVGSLHGRIGQEQGHIKSLLRTGLIDLMAWAHRGRRKDEVKTGDLAIVDTIATRHYGDGTPLLAGEFIDPHWGGLHRDNDRYFAIAEAALKEIQGRAPRVALAYVQGPGFETAHDKLAFRSTGCDVIGMSGHEVSLATLWNIPVAQLVLVTNGAFEPHSHEGNQDTGRASAQKTQAVLEVLANTWPSRLTKV
jgi:purine nucleoside phosphorylase